MCSVTLFVHLRIYIYMCVERYVCVPWRVIPDIRAYQPPRMHALYLTVAVQCLPAQKSGGTSEYRYSVQTNRQIDASNIAGATRRMQQHMVICPMLDTRNM